jgi:lantibiotic transport system ATP-binding protein
MTTNIIETIDLTRKYGTLTAVDAINLIVPQASIYGFLGPNGAGKTTTIRMLLGLIRPDMGKVILFGEDLNRNKLNILRKMGSLVETPSLYPHLTGFENLAIIQKLVDGKRSEIERVLKLVDMTGSAQRLVREYSLGMRQRLALAMSLLNHPELLILDEPTNGLDPSGIHEIRELIKRLPEEEGITVFVSSHLLNEVEQMATWIGIIQQGRLIFQGMPDTLRVQYQQMLQLCAEPLEDASALLTAGGWTVQHNQNHHLLVRVNHDYDVALINRTLVEAGCRVSHLNLMQPSLEDIFLTMTEK